MINLYHCAGARSFRPLWMLEEMGLPYELHTMPFPPRFRQPGWLETNPLGTIPYLVDGITVMTESSAICHYLGTRYGPTDLVVAAGDAAYGAYLNFLVMGEATLTFPQTIHLRYAVLEPPERRLPQAAADYVRWFHVRLKAASTMMGPDYVCAGRFTAADISFGYALKLATALGIDEAFSDDIKAYLQRITSRPAYARAMAAEAVQDA